MPGHLPRFEDPCVRASGANITAYWDALAYLSVAVIQGTLIGKKLLRKMSEKAFMMSFKIVLVLISLRVIFLEAMQIYGW